MTIDSKEEYIASCSDDGKVVIFGLCENTHDQVIEFNRPIKSIELDPSFASTFSFVTGDTKVYFKSRRLDLTRGCYNSFILTARIR